MKIITLLLIALITSKKKKKNKCKNYCQICDTANKDCLDCEEESNYYLEDGRCEFSFNNFSYNYSDVKKGCIEYDGAGLCEVCKGK